jgi:hypothetical protein
MYLSIMGSRAAFGGTYHIQGSEWEVEIFGHLHWRIGFWFKGKEDGWMGN